MKTIITAPLRITVEAHKAIKKKAKEKLCGQQVIIRRILHDWALKQKQAK